MAGQSYKREFDERDRAMARMNAVTAASSLTSAYIEAGVITTIAEGDEKFTSLVEEIATANIQAALGGTVAAAVANVEAQLGATEVEVATVTAPPAPSSPAPSGTATAEGGVEIKFGKYKGMTLAQVYSKDPEYVTTFLAEKTNNEFVKKAAQKFVAALSA